MPSGAPTMPPKCSLLWEKRKRLLTQLIQKNPAGSASPLGSSLTVVASYDASVQNTGISFESSIYPRIDHDRLHNLLDLTGLNRMQNKLNATMTRQACTQTVKNEYGNPLERR